MDATMKENSDDPPEEMSINFACGECSFMGRKKKFLKKHQMEVGHAGKKMVLQVKHSKVPNQVEDPADLAPGSEPVDEPYPTTFDEPEKKKKKNKKKSDPEPAEKVKDKVSSTKGLDKVSSGQKYQCKVCEKLKNSKKALKNHMVKHDKDASNMVSFTKGLDKVSSNKGSTVLSSGQKFQCKVCEKEKKSKKSLKNHMVKHDKDASNMVSFAKGLDKVSSTKGLDKVSSNKGSTVLPSGQKLSCNQCDKFYSNTFTLRRHMETIHNVQKESLPSLPSTRTDCIWCGRYCLLGTK